MEPDASDVDVLDSGSDPLHDSLDAKKDEYPEQEPTTPSAARERWDSLALYGSFAISAALTFCFSTDDPFITLRYAANLVHGHGLVFNVGDRVEGFTSPLHLLLVSLVYLIPGSHYLLKVKLLSLVFAILTLVAARQLVRAMDFPAWGRTTCLILVGASWSLAIAASNGLETALTCWLTTLLVAGLVRGYAVRRPVFMAWCAAGLAAVRPEGILVAVVLAAISIIVESGTTAVWRRVSWFAGAIAAEVVIVVARLAYYGQLLPNTYFAKRVPLALALHWGLSYLNQLLPGVPLPMRILIVLLGVTGVVSVVWSKQRRLWYLVGAVAAQVGFILLSGGDWMIGGRFFAPVVPAAAVLLTRGVVQAVQFSGRRYAATLRIAHIAFCSVVGAALAFIVVVPFTQFHDPVWSSDGRIDDASLVAAGGYGVLSQAIWPDGEAVLGCLAPGSLVAYSEVGYAGFEHLGLRFLDTRGITDSSIAHSAPADLKALTGVNELEWFSPTSTVGERILETRPVVILSFDWAQDPLASVLRGAYRLRRIVHKPGFGQPIAVYQLVDLPNPSQLSGCTWSPPQPLKAGSAQRGHKN